MTRKKVHTCKCGCEQTHPPLPPSTWMSYISGWHRVRMVGVDGPQYSSTEIGCGNDPADAVQEAWEHLHDLMEIDKKGHCWYCNDKPDWYEEYFEGKAPPCPNCKIKPIPITIETKG